MIDLQIPANEMPGFDTSPLEIRSESELPGAYLLVELIESVPAVSDEFQFLHHLVGGGLFLDLLLDKPVQKPDLGLEIVLLTGDFHQ